MKTVLIIALLMLSGCGWFHRKTPAPQPSELIVTGAPAGSILFVDGAQAGHETQANDRPQVLDVAPGTHMLEVKVGGNVTYRENAYVAVGDKHVITVLSGFTP